MITELLKRKADLETKDDYGDTPLLKAVKNDAPENVIDLLLERGANVHAVAEDRKTILHFAAQKRETNLMNQLTKEHSYVDAQDNVGWTPLHEAAYNGSKDAAAILIEKGQSLINFFHASSSNNSISLVVNCHNCTCLSGPTIRQHRSAVDVGMVVIVCIP